MLSWECWSYYAPDGILVSWLQIWHREAAQCSLAPPYHVMYFSWLVTLGQSHSAKKLFLSGLSFPIVKNYVDPPPPHLKLQQRPNPTRHCKWQTTSCLWHLLICYSLSRPLCNASQQKLFPANVARPSCALLCRPDQRFLNLHLNFVNCIQLVLKYTLTLWQHAPNWWQSLDDNLNLFPSQLGYNYSSSCNYISLLHFSAQCHSVSTVATTQFT